MSGNVERFEKAMNQGHNAAWDQMWELAAKYYQQALAEIPNDPKALTSLALALYESRNYEKALLTYQKASELMPDDPIPLEKTAELLNLTGQVKGAVDTYLKCAEFYLKQRDVNKAIDLWTKIVTIRPDHLIARSRLALVYERLGKKSDSVKEYLAVASLLQHAGEVQKSIQAINRALQVDPGSIQVQNALAMVKAGQLLPTPSQPRQEIPREKVIPVAQTQKDQASQDNLDPITEAQARALTTLAGLLFEQEESSEPVSKRGMSDIVRGAFGSTNDHTDNTTILLHISQVIDFQSQKKDLKARDELEKAIELGLDHPAAFFDLGCLQYQTGKFNEAVNTLESIKDLFEYILPVRLITGRSRFQLKQYQAAALDFVDGLRYADMQVVGDTYASALSDAYDPIIEAQSQQQDGEPPIQLCENIMKMLIRPDWRKQLIEARKQLSDQDGLTPSPVAELLTTAGSGEIVEALSGVQKLARANKFQAALDEAFYILSSAPFYLPLHVTIGDLLLQEGIINAALEKYSTVARSYAVRGEANRSIILYRKISDLSPMDMDARKNLIDLMVDGKQYSAAIDEYLNLGEVYYNLADLDHVRSTINEGLELAQKTNASRADKIKLLTRLADIELQSLNLRQAQHLYEEMRTLQPDYEPTRLALIELCFRLGQPTQVRKELADYLSLLTERNQSEQAWIFLEKLVDQHPDEPILLHQEGEFLRAAGRNEEALEKLDAAGELYLTAGDRAAAAEVIRSILAMNPPNVQQYQQLLAQIRK